METCSHEVGNIRSQVIDSRPRGSVIRRSRKCLLCGERFITWEMTRPSFEKHEAPLEDKDKARSAVVRAIRKGKLIRPDHCSKCGKECKPEAHHHNGYEKSHRLDVIWVCRDCHIQQHY